MRKRQASIADHIMEAQALLDGRYRLDKEIRRSPTTTIHLATHRNGSTAWLKMPLLAAHASQIALEARIANTIGSPLIVRDDGTTPDGMPYLILDPPAAEPLKDLRARGAAGAKTALARAMTIGDALARVVASIHAIGFVTAGLADEDVLVFENGDVALLDLHALTPLTPAGVALDVQHLLRALRALTSEVADPGSSRAVLDAMLAGTYADVAAAQAGWRAASPDPIVAPVRGSGSFPDLGPPSSARLSSHDTPLALTLGEHPEPPPESRPIEEGSMIGYLRSAKAPSVAPPPVRNRPVMYDPLSKTGDVPRLVQATSRAHPEPARRSRNAGLLVAAVGAPLLALAITAAVIVTREAAPDHVAAAATLTAGPAPSASAAVRIVPPANEGTAAPSAPAVPAPPALPEAVAEELEDTATLSTQNAPPGREVLLDGKPVGKTPLEGASVPCGRHLLQMNAGAPKQPVDLPCGGLRTVRYDAKGHWALK
ncbi:MAG: serine/threonine protein kinase [Labilithrix sp.]|nr:serine/threonine protein kinase [Labilithrix sp.]